MIIPAPMDKVIVLICIYCYEFAVTRNHVCLLLKYYGNFHVFCAKQNHLTTG